MGAIFDQACILDQVKCDGSGSCWIYDTDFISRGIVWAGVIVKGISALCFAITYLIYRSSLVKEEVDQMTLSVSQDGHDYDNHGYVNDNTSKTHM